ncbi:MAG: ketohydroxyglutarate aldolase [Calothrix sp. C42_A2020_038]|nr:ketohydroxyglutarate aldolase [Calothrix sp. C42_A2020_038]
MAKVNLSILVDEQHKDKILEVVEALQAYGMKVESIMEQIGVITGSIDSDIKALSNITGVAAVEVAQQYQLPPPSSEIQ